jgi:transcriptional regulator with PAS, ATPase and Fis domain
MESMPGSRSVSTLTATRRATTLAATSRQGEPPEIGCSLEEAESDDLETLFPEIVGRSAPLRHVLLAAAHLAATELPVLIEGESGTGKELVAHAIHRLSRRGRGPFVSENCGAISESLVETELFGHERGAFTGAVDSKAGLLERAHGGTLFLDEIGEMDLQLQKKFLRVLEDREVRRVGGRSRRAVDFRLISATNRILDDLVDMGSFRQDLFYRVNAASLALPPLRERREDIPCLVEAFSHRFAVCTGRPPLDFTDEALVSLRNYPWPGNVRELHNEIWRLATTHRGRVAASHLSRRILNRLAHASRVCRPPRTLEEVEQEAFSSAIRMALEKSAGNRAEAARLLGIGRATLYRRMEKYNIAITRGGTVRP